MGGGQTVSVEVVAPGALDTRLRAAWTALRAANLDLWSPFFDLRYLDVVSRFAPDPHVAVVRRAGEVVAFLPFQGRRGGFARPLGAPLADQHGLIAASGDVPDLADVIAGAGLAGFGYAGLAGPVRPGEEAIDLHIADVRNGGAAWHETRRTQHGDHLRKSARRRRQGESEWGPMRVEAVTGDRALLATALNWKAAQLQVSARHDIMATPWIAAFLEALHGSPDPHFRAEIWTLRFGQHLAAVEYCLHSDDVVHSWFPSYDQAYARVSPGTLLMDGMIEAAAARGDSFVDLGAGHDHYKKYSANMAVRRQVGTVRVPGPRTVLVAAMDAGFALLSRAPSPRVAALSGKVRRRAEQVLAAEPTAMGRLRGFAAAMRAMRGPAQA
jgi:CelD/BcsL family acetyltransferase involved in cellulose biosynthesis